MRWNLLTIPVSLIYCRIIRLYYELLDDVLIPPIFRILEHNKEQNRTHNLYCDILENTVFMGENEN